MQKSSVVLDRNPERKPKEDISGKVFNQWTVLNFEGRDEWNKGYYLCKCSCGNIGILSGSNLKSCIGCMDCRNKRISKRKTKHGMANSPEYGVWCLIKTRCYNPNRDDYKWYGEKGSRVCDRWLNSFPNFYEDMGPRPGPEYTIERRDWDKDYEPSNCYWLLGVLQNGNKSSNVRIEFQGENLCTAAMARKHGIKQATLAQRIREGWSHEDAIKTPVFKCKNHGKLTFEGKTQGLSGWAKDLGVSYQWLWRKLKEGETLEEFISKQRQNGSAPNQA